MSADKLQKQSDQTKDASIVSPERSRRRMLKNTMAVPIIMTLGSGSALARTSNLVGPITDPNEAMKDANGDLYCVHPDPNDEDRDVSITDPVDLGKDPHATVKPIALEDQDGNPIPGTHDLSTQAMDCESRNGILVSMNAWNSVGPKLTDITYL